MGHEYRLHVDPEVHDLEAACEQVFVATEWCRIPTSFLDVPGIGVQLGATPASASWPHAADLRLQDDGTIYVLCHDSAARRFMEALVEVLRAAGHTVRIDDDV